MKKQLSHRLEGEAAADYVARALGRPLDVLLRFPRFLYIEPVNYCNARCTMCGIDFDSRGKRFMPAALFEKIVSELPPWRDHLERVGLYVDCEPLLDPGLEKKIAALKAIGIRRTYLASNMSLMTAERAETVLRAGLDLLYITIDSLDPARYESIRRGLRFDRVYGQTLAFLRLRDRLRPELKVRVQMIGQPANQDEWDRFVPHWRPLMAPTDEVVVHPAHSWGGRVKDVCATDSCVVANSVPCIALWSTLGVHVDGTVNVCCIDTGGEIHLGNVNTERITDIWTGKTMTRVRDLHRQGRRESVPICDGCTVWHGAQHAPEEVVAS